jgi:hypothetical protein
MIEYVLIMAAIAIGLAVAVWRAMRDIWAVLPEEDEHGADLPPEKKARQKPIGIMQPYVDSGDDK